MTGGQFRYTFTYNDEGLRTSKTASGVTHKYVWEGSTLVSESWGNHLLIYLYDESGSPIGLQYRSTAYAEGVFDTYYFEKNLFGDITAVYNAAGSKLGSYTYDAWGNCTVSVEPNTTAADKRVVRNYNSFRYRGYYYDTETGLYYLQSRYYNPQWGRFLNADGYVNANGDLIGFNMYAYCSNNPVIYLDPSGEVIITAAVIAGAAIGGAISLVSSIISEAIEGKIDWKDVGQIAISTIIGMTEGAAIVLFPMAAMAISAGASAFDTAINGAIDGNSIGEIIIDSLVSGAIGAVAGAGGSGFVKGGKLINDAAGSVGNAIRKGVHPAVKKSARKTIKKAAKKIGREYVSGQIEDFAYGGISKFSSFYIKSVVRIYGGG